MTVFDSNGVKVYVNGVLKKSLSTVSSEDVKGIARAAGVKKFTAQKDGRTLGEHSFPVTLGDIHINEYNEAKKSQIELVWTS